MPASCPFCGATLNFGLKFCVVCGRHTTASDMSKLGGGLKGGIRQSDMTRRLDDNLSAGDFERARNPSRLRKQFRSLSEQLFYVFIGIALFFCAVRFTLQTWFPGQIHNVLHPLFGPNSAAVEETLTGTSTPDKTAEEIAADEKKAAADQEAQDQKKNAGKKKKGKKKVRRRAKHAAAAQG